MLPLFQYFRVHQESFGCGHVRDGTLSWSNSAVTNPPIEDKKWYKLKIEVFADKTVKVHMAVDGNWNELGSCTATFNTRGYGGLIVLNGYKNKVEFRNFELLPGTINFHDIFIELHGMIPQTVENNKSTAPT